MVHRPFVWSDTALRLTDGARCAGFGPPEWRVWAVLLRGPPHRYQACHKGSVAVGRPRFTRRRARARSKWKRAVQDWTRSYRSPQVGGSTGPGWVAWGSPRTRLLAPFWVTGDGGGGGGVW